MKKPNFDPMSVARLFYDFSYFNAKFTRENLQSFALILIKPVFWSIS